MRTFEYRHVVGFEDTNLVGNVYYVNHLKWQGRCRELFLRQHVPELLDELSRGLYLVTTRCSCEYLAEIFAFDEIVVHMSLAELAQNRMDLHFDYLKVNGEGGPARDQATPGESTPRGEQEMSGELVARGDQQVVVMRRDGSRVVPAPIPPELREALRAYGGA